MTDFKRAEYAFYRRVCVSKGSDNGFALPQWSQPRQNVRMPDQFGNIRRQQWFQPGFVPLIRRNHIRKRARAIDVFDHNAAINL